MLKLSAKIHCYSLRCIAGGVQMRKSANSNEKIHEALDLLKEASQEKRVELMEIIAGLYEKAKDAQSAAADKVKAAATTVNDSAHDKPWIYVGGAALVGFVVGLFVRSRR